MSQVIFEEKNHGVAIDRIIRETEFTMPIKHMHSDYEIYYLLEGAQYYFVESESFYIHSGTLVFVDRDKIHRTSSAGEEYQDRILIELKKEWMTGFLKSLGLWSLEQFFSQYTAVKLDDEGQNYVKNLLFSIANELNKRKINYECVVKMKLAELMLYVIRCKQNKALIKRVGAVQSLKHNKVHEVADYIQNHYRERLSLQCLAENFYVSKCYLSRIFKEVTGFTVTEYITIQKIKQGKLLLEEAHYSITQIAEMTGFESITYFEKMFKRYTEHTPLKYRKMQKSLIDKFS